MASISTTNTGSGTSALTPSTTSTSTTSPTSSTTTTSSPGSGIISALGTGSGLDIQSIVSQLVAAEGDPTKTLLNAREATVTAQISAFGSISSGLSALQKAAQALQSTSSFQGRTASSSDTSLLTVSADAGTATGSYQVVVQSLAAAQKLSSAGFASSTTTVGDGTLSFTSGSNQFSVTIDSSNDTLAGIRDAINNAAGNNSVGASLITVDNGSGGSVSKLVLTATNPGTANTLSVSVSDADGNNTDQSGLSQLAYDAASGGANNLSQVSGAQDAVLQLDGQTVTRSTNTISDAIDGVTLNLQQADPSTTINVSIANDTQSSVTAVQNFVSAYNSLQSTMANLTAYDASTKQAGVLLGDSTVQTIGSQLSKALFNQYPALSPTFTSLAEVGITTDPLTGQMSLDTNALNTALSTDSNGVAALFNGSNGVTQSLNTVIDGLVGSTGLIQSRTNGLQNTEKDITNQRNELNTRLQSLQSQLLAQYTAMDTLVAQLKQTSSYLTQQFASLTSLSSGKTGG